MMYISQIIRLNTLNLHTAVCQLHLNKNEGKKNTTALLIATDKYGKVISFASLSYKTYGKVSTKNV